MFSQNKEGKNIQWKKDRLFIKWCSENETAISKRMKLEHSLTPYTKIYSKQIKDLQVRSDTRKILEENIVRKVFDKSQSNIFWDPSPNIMETEAKEKKGDLIKLKRFGTAKEIINKMKRQPMEWDKVSANDATKRLISKMYEQLIQFNNNKNN